MSESRLAIYVASFRLSMDQVERLPLLDVMRMAAERLRHDLQEMGATRVGPLKAQRLPALHVEDEDYTLQEMVELTRHGWAVGSE